MHDEIDGLCDLRLGINKGCLRMVPHDQIGKAMKGLFGGVGMDGSQ
jgi:hypothetical protein